ncbi:MAG: CoA-acylating methylmalonate-semialdehyde dehydrogenase, partial [Rhodospirillales bacterium]|nr:CoA-acylating methylmalonate-semialdehyde dehydrogenase [Rhodospirillales bacterium]
MTIAKLKNYVNGEWREASDGDWLDVENPSTAEIIAQVPICGKNEAEAAIAAAKAAFPGWAATPADRRVAPLFRLRELFVEHGEELARLITQEMGKSLPDARAEMKRALENVEAACGMPILQQGDKLVGAAAGIDGEVLKLPVGVFAMVPPFNFPGMVPFWFLPYAIAAGNTYVVKPSEQVPMTLQRVAELIDQCGFPKGVFNLVNGAREVVETFIESPDIAGISFVGSSRVAKIVAEGCARTGKRFQAMGSAKNHLVVMPDAKIDDVVRNLITSGYGCAGQRCMASSVIVGVGAETCRLVTEKFVEASKNVIVANPLDPKVADEGMVMGPVISAAAKERIEGLIETGVKEGATLALDGRGVKVEGGENGHFIGTTVFTGVKPGMEIHDTEIFGPVQSIVEVDTLDEAIGVVNGHIFGNGASIYTQNGYYARKFKMEAKAGMIGVNVGIPAP